MEKKVVNRALVGVVIVALLAVIGWLGFSLKQEKQTNQDMQQLAELDKQEMEKEYQNFALQYSEMKTYIKNDCRDYPTEEGTGHGACRVAVVCDTD